MLSLLRAAHRKFLSVTPNFHIAFTEPEHGPNMDLLGTSPKASLGQYTSWQEWGVLGACGPWEFFSDLLLPVWTEVPGPNFLSFWSGA